VNTLVTIGILIVFAAIAYFLMLYLLNFAGLPGALLAGRPGLRSKGRFMFGSIVSAIGQSFVYLSNTAFVVNWTLLAIRNQDVSILAWPLAFLAVTIPLWMNLGHARTEASEMEHASAQTEALHLTFVLVPIGFLVFAFVPSIMYAMYSWLPYV